MNARCSLPRGNTAREFPALKHAGSSIFSTTPPAPGATDGVGSVNFHTDDHKCSAAAVTRRAWRSMPRSRAHAPAWPLLSTRGAPKKCLRHECTSFIRLISLASDRLCKRNEIIITDLDHEPTLPPGWSSREWVRSFWWKMRDDGCLHVDDLKPLLTSARGWSHHSDIQCAGFDRGCACCRDAAHAAGAEIFLEHAALRSHGQIDVQAFDCDYLVCSGYKIFAAYGFMWVAMIF